MGDPERVEGEPLPNRALVIRNEFPSAIFHAIEAQFDKRSVVGFPAGFLGERIGFIEVDNPSHPIRTLESRVHGSLSFSQWEDIPGESGQRGVGEKIPEFKIDTRFRLPKHTFLDESQTQNLLLRLAALNYPAELKDFGNGNRNLKIPTPQGVFTMTIGWASADKQVQWHQSNIEKNRESHPGWIKEDQRSIDRLLRGDDDFNINLETENSHPSHAPGGIPVESPEQVIAYLDRSRDLTEAAATALIDVLANGKRFPHLKMTWLPPEALELMSTSASSEVTGRIDPTIGVETTVKEDFGLERLKGLPLEALAELRRLKDRLKDPARALFMKKHGFKQSNGAVFWGPPGTGKTLAGEALAQEAGCQHVVLKLDELMTSYIHGSASRLGERLREIKSQAIEGDKSIVIQIDEADTILRPVSGEGASSRDAEEVRAVLLREFQEPSNVFYILTTNLDPRDPRQADPAIVRNQRVGNLIAFGMPSGEGRQQIFDREMSKRTGANLKWENIDLSSLAQLSAGFSPSDIQEVLSIAAGQSYDPDTQAAFINQVHLETAINLIKARKMMEEEIRRPFGFKKDSGV